MSYPPRLRRMWRRGLRLKARLVDVPTLSRPTLERIDGRPFVVLPGVFNPNRLRTGALFARALDDELAPAGAEVLELGTGSGAVAVFAAARGATVTAVDLNPTAARCARANALLNALPLEVHHGDLFDPVSDRRFDRVLFNPPYFLGRPKDDADLAWRSEHVPERFAAALPDHLQPGGLAALILSSDGDERLFLGPLEQAGFQIRVKRRWDLINEVVSIYVASRS